MSAPTGDSIEILSVSLLDQNRNCVNALKRLAGSLGLEFGWHYLLDLTWIISRLGPLRGRRIIDAGAGTGVMQWYLADQGAEVISVDRSSRANISFRFRSRFRVKGLRPQDLTPSALVFRQGFSKPEKLQARARDLAGLAEPRRSSGRVMIYNQDLRFLTDIADNSVDAVVAVSALEHNPSEELGQVVTELVRVLKPGGKLLATLGAARDTDWFHEPSAGWCYTDSSLRSHFALPADLPSNYDQYDRLFQEIRGCAELRDHLARFYARSGNNGMPWGKWDPQYQIVGVCKVKDPAQ